MSNASTFPAVAGLAAGIAFVVAFSMLAGPVSPKETETMHISLAIDDLKSTYKSGESIVFNVAAKGVLDSACNYGTPNVVMRNESNGRIIFWPNPFAANTAIKCAAEEIDKKWKFEDNHEMETIFDMPGRYSVIASYGGMTVEKGFLVK